MKRRITFHIGMEKTGTDSFQRFCTEHQALLERSGTLYPTRSFAFGIINHAPLVSCYLDYDDLSIRSSGQKRDAVLRSLMAEIEDSAASRILISAEHLSSRFRDAEIAQLAEDFADFDCRIVVVVREHRARFYSAYNQSIRSGRDITLEAYCDEVFHPSNPYMRYATIIDAWERIFGRENISVFCHSRGQDVVPILCRAVISPDFIAPANRAYWDNLSTGPAVTEWLRRANGLVARLPGMSRPAVRQHLRAPRRTLARLLSMFVRDQLPWSLSEHDAARLAEIEAIDAAWLFEHYGICLGDYPQSAAIKDSTAAK